MNPQTLPPFTAPSEQGDYELLLTATDVDPDGNPIPLASTALVTVDPPPPPPGPRVTVNGVDSSGLLDSVLPGTELTVVVENAPSNGSTIDLFRENECCWPANSLEHYLVDGVANPPPYTFTAPDVDGWYDVVLVSFDTDSEGNPIGLAAGPTVKVETPPPPNPVLTINGHENETTPELDLGEPVTITVTNPSHRDNESVGFYDLNGGPPQDPPVLPPLRSELVPLNGNTAVSLNAPGVEGYYHVLLVYEDAQYGWQKVPNVNPPVVHVAPQVEECTNCPNDARLTLDRTQLHPGDTLTVTVANAPAESDRVQIWTSGTCCRGLPAMDAVGLGTPKDGDIPLTAPQKPADYYVVLLGTPQEPDGSPHIITQSVEFHVLQCLPGEQVCAPAGTDTRWFYDTDAIGSVRLITDDGGGTVARYDYAPFGEPTLAENPDNQRRFAGKEFDAESRLNYFGARYFAAELGRFTAADPGAADGDPLNPQSWNAYAYSRNNPLRFVDPLGTCSVDDAGNLVEDNESSSIVYGGPCLRYSDSATVTPSGPTFHDYYAGLFATFATLTTSFQTIADAVIPSVCGGGGFGYGGVGLGAGRVHGEVLGLVQYDSQSGGAHGGLLGIGAGHFTGGFESMRTWNDWQTHTGPIALGGVEIPGASRQFGKKIDVHSRDIGGLAQYDDGNLSLGLYSGITLGSRRTFGGGAYVTLSWSGCR